MSDQPQHGFTKDGKPVHGNTQDHRKGSFNKRVGLLVTEKVGSMGAAYSFMLVTLIALPSIITQAFNLHVFPHWLTNPSMGLIIAWLSSYFLQLTLLPIIIVGQNAQAEAMDARAAKGFEDTEKSFADNEKILNMLDLNTEGGLTDVLAAIKDLAGKVEKSNA